MSSAQILSWILTLLHSREGGGRSPELGGREQSGPATSQPEAGRFCPVHALPPPADGRSTGNEGTRDRGGQELTL